MPADFPDRALHEKVDDVSKEQKRSKREQVALAVVVTFVGFLLAIGGNFMWWVTVEKTAWYNPYIVGIGCLVIAYFLILYIVKQLSK